MVRIFDVCGVVLGLVSLLTLAHGCELVPSRPCPRLDHAPHVFTLGESLLF
jgi:hypothetical protein